MSKSRSELLTYSFKTDFKVKRVIASTQTLHIEYLTENGRLSSLYSKICVLLCVN